jgi:tetratricopeptide (TPR) repeat protein
MNVRLLTIVFVTLAIGTEASAGPTSFRARQYMESGLARERLGQHQLALNDFTQALASKDLSVADRVRATFNQGVALDALGRTKEAVASYSSSQASSRFCSGAEQPRERLSTFGPI